MIRTLHDFIRTAGENPSGRVFAGEKGFYFCHPWGFGGEEMDEGVVAELIHGRALHEDEGEGMEINLMALRMLEEWQSDSQAGSWMQMALV